MQTMLKGHVLSERLLKQHKFHLPKDYFLSWAPMFRAKLNCSRKERAKRHAYLTILWCSVAVKQRLSNHGSPAGHTHHLFLYGHELSMVFTFPPDWKKTKTKVYFTTWENYMKFKLQCPLITLYWNKAMFFCLVLAMAAFLLQREVATEVLSFTRLKYLLFCPLQKKFDNPSYKEKWFRVRKESTDSGLRQAWAGVQHLTLTVWPGAEYLTSLSFSSIVNRGNIAYG